MSRRIIPGSTPPPSPKDENGAYLKVQEGPLLPAPGPSESIDRTEDIDAMLKDGLHAIYKAMRLVHESLATGKLDRNAMTTLKDMMTLLKALKEKEKSLLEDLDEESLRKLSE